VSYARDHLIPLVDEGLGNSAYLAGLGDGRALAVDASRDLRALHEAAAKRGLRVAFAADTHLHADFLSGAVQLAADDGATVLAAAAGHRAFPHTALADGDEADLGGLRLRALATPGHTDEHLSYLLLDGDQAQVGQTVSGVVAGPIYTNGKVVIPDGSPVTMRVAQVNSARLKGVPSVTLSLVQVSVQGRNYPLSGSYTAHGAAHGKSTAVKTGIGAGIGAAIGVIAGGGKGAAIGAGLGAGGGLGAAAMTATPARIGAETAVSFRVSRLPASQ